jgi:hypothetical protein
MEKTTVQVIEHPISIDERSEQVSLDRQQAIVHVQRNDRLRNKALLLASIYEFEPKLPNEKFL